MIEALHKAYRFIKRLEEKNRYRRLKMYAQKQIRRYGCPYKLHIGCGHVKFEGWVNIDLNGTADEVDIVWDATKKFPLEDESCAFIYSEHFLEHLTIEQASLFLCECRRLLELGGVLRIAMPSLETIVKKYSSLDWRDQDWLSWPEHRFIQTRAEMLNIAFRWWGHQWFMIAKK